MKINFIVPGPELNMYKLGGVRIPNIGVVYLATILRNAGHKVKVYEENVISRVTDWKGKLKKEVLDADAFGISILTPAAPRGYNYADQIKKAKPDAKVVIGGMHATALPKEAAKHADNVVIKESEDIIRKVFERNIKTKIIEGGPIDINKLPFPDFSLVEGHKKITYFPFSASRACPYNCPFCQVPSAFERKYRAKDPQLVEEEMVLRKQQGQKKLFFNDDLFGLEKQGTLTYLKNLVRKKIRFKEITGETRVNIIHKNPELLKLMKSLGFYNLHVGAESASQKNLVEYNKVQTTKDIADAVKTANKHGIKINGMFILGMDHDDSSTVNTTHKFFRDIHMDTATFSIMYPIPGTKLFETLEKEDRILTKDWSLYDGTHVVFKPKNITPTELQKIWINSWKVVYPWYSRYGMAIRGFFKLFWYPGNTEYLKVLKKGNFSSLGKKIKTLKLPISFRSNFLEKSVERFIT